MKLYKLTFYDLELSYDDYKEGFVIGIFSSFSKAEQTAKYCLRNVEGFKDYPCDYQIEIKDIIGTADTNLKEVYIIEGWNVNENLNETDIIESDCFTDKKSAECELENMKQKYSRCEWALNKYAIDKCEWTDGFVRV